MKLLPTQKRVDTQDGLGLGIEAAVIMVLFFGVGAGLDWLFGTRPVFMIVFTVVAVVGAFSGLSKADHYRQAQSAYEARRRKVLGDLRGARRGDPT